MDCEAFEAAMMGELYGELDEVSSAAVKRHASGCARCTALLDGLRATRRLAVLPTVDVPAGLTERILATAAQITPVVPMRRRAARALSVAGTWAMRPQSAMAAVFMVMLGTSLLLLRGRSSRAPAESEVTVTEHGTPAPAFPTPVVQAPAGEPPPSPMAMASASPSPGPGGAAAPAAPRAEAKMAAAPPPPMFAQNADQPLDDLRPAKAAEKGRDQQGTGFVSGAGGAGAGFAAPPPAVAAPAAAPAPQTPAPVSAYASRAEVAQPVSPFDAAVRLYESGRFDEATRAFEALAGQDVNADLYAARSIREGKGCRPAVARFDRVAQRATGSPPGWDALLEGAICYRSMGDFPNARVRLTPLLSVDSHKDRARAELDRLGDVQSGGSAGAGAAKAARPRAPAAAAPASPPADVGGQ